MASFNTPNQKMHSVGLDGLGAFLEGKIPKNAGLDREEIVRLFNRNMSHRGQVANRPEDHQAALDAGKSPVQDQFPRGILDFGTGTPPDTSLPESIPTEILLQFLETRQNKRPLPSPPDSGYNDQAPERFEMMQEAPRPERFEMMQGAPRSPDSFDRDDLERNDRMHDKAMRGGDDTLSYTESGDIIIPKKAAQANPGLAMAAMQALADMGANPNQYVAGSPEGSYNPETGAQEFAWWEDLVKFGVKGADYIGNSKFGQAALTGVGTAAASKYLFGQDTKTALATGAGAGLGYGVGNYLENRANVKASELPQGKDGYAEMPKNPTLNNYKTADGTLKDLGSAAMDAFGNFSGKGLKYAVSGAGIGQMLAPVQSNFSPLNIKNPTATKMPAIAQMSDFTDQFDQNQRPNLSATLPQEAPIAPIMPTVLPQGVTYQDRVRDRETGEYRYTGMTNPQDQSAFARAIKGSSRRKGLGMGFGNMILA